MTACDPLLLYRILGRLAASHPRATLCQYEALQCLAAPSIAILHWDRGRRPRPWGKAQRGLGAGNALGARAAEPPFELLKPSAESGNFFNQAWFPLPTTTTIRSFLGLLLCFLPLSLP